MSDPIIHDSTPKGSAILAYGESTRTANIPLILAVFAVLASVIFVVFTGMTMFTHTIPVPRNVSLLAYVRPSVPLPNNAPEIWRRARSHASAFPIFVGFALGDDDTSYAFAIAPRTFSAPDAETSWVWQLLRERDVQDLEFRSPRSLVSSWGEYTRMAWLRVWPARLFKPKADAHTLSEDRSVGGAIRGRLWETDLAAPTVTETRDRIMAQNMLMLGAVPNAWPIVESMLRERGFDMRLETIPTAIRWSVDSEDLLSVSLEFADAIQTSTRIAIAGSVGLADRGFFTLADGTVMPEFRLPEEAIASASSSEWTLDDGRKIIFDEKTVLLGDPELIRQEAELPKHCQGHVLAVFDGSSTKSLFKKIGFPGLSAPERLIWLEKDGRLTMCWE